MDYKIESNITPEEYNQLRNSVGWVLMIILECTKNGIYICTKICIYKL